MRSGVRALWLAASARERNLLALGALVIGIAAVYVLWQPMQRDLAVTSRAIAQIEARTVSAQAAVNEIAGLSREARAPRTPDARAAAERIVDAQGLRGAMTAIDAQPDRVRITFSAVQLGALHAALDRLGREEHLFPVEALLAAQVVPGTVRAEVSLARPSAR
jgi:type II secretory pathway component PulM